MRILYVEDNMANVSLVKRVARQHEIINYIDGADALKNFTTDQPDLVLMDVQLAGSMNGLEVVQKLREQGYNTPIIAVTAYAMLGDRERCLAAGCDDYIAKPLPIPRLVEILQHYEEATRKRTQTVPNQTPPSEQVTSEVESVAEASAPAATVTETHKPTSPAASVVEGLDAETLPLPTLPEPEPEGKAEALPPAAQVETPSSTAPPEDQAEVPVSDADETEPVKPSRIEAEQIEVQETEVHEVTSVTEKTNDKL
ncbi:MAG: hypothetical protein OHK0046_32750 [Anaerolineae bacterium]